MSEENFYQQSLEYMGFYDNKSVSYQKVIERYLDILNYCNLSSYLNKSFDFGYFEQTNMCFCNCLLGLLDGYLEDTVDFGLLPIYEQSSNCKKILDVTLDITNGFYSRGHYDLGNNVLISNYRIVSAIYNYENDINNTITKKYS